MTYNITIPSIHKIVLASRGCLSIHLKRGAITHISL